ncbi:hypothetical protein BJ138DRAFT_1103740 [Hygrophoropsis aurantiaca]|uniref:Uncharacterized protein n=1 Tax=Hygrophoropsis aurantiaca TaxID=72124 RepID=A0ACB8A485_9AGAM|nr:hypothetical protein BJ138DRAFT_1103740 [Hygrophoropsis aurantiaca]
MIAVGTGPKDLQVGSVRSRVRPRVFAEVIAAMVHLHVTEKGGARSSRYQNSPRSRLCTAVEKKPLKLCLKLFISFARYENELEARKNIYVSSISYNVPDDRFGNSQLQISKGCRTGNESEISSMTGVYICVASDSMTIMRHSQKRYTEPRAGQKVGASTTDPVIRLGFRKLEDGHTSDEDEGKGAARSQQTGDALQGWLWGRRIRAR